MKRTHLLFVLALALYAGSVCVPANAFAATKKVSRVSLAAKVYVTPNGFATIKQPKGWTPTPLLDLQKSSTGEGLASVLFTDPKTGTTITVTSWNKKSSIMSVLGGDMEGMVQYVADLYTTNTEDLKSSFALLDVDATGTDIHGTLLSKKKITVSGAKGYELDFDRTDLAGVWHIKDTVVERNGVFYELATKVSSEKWTTLKPVIDATFPTLQLRK